MALSTYNRQIPEDALTIIKHLEDAGYEAYIVGGCVRDMLMQREPNDWDITTSAKPEEVKAVFKRSYDTGIEHGTVTVILEDGEHYEITTYRIEGEYKDFRHPEEVSFVEDITLDLSRRDFTMNAIAYHPTRGFMDPYNGVKHIDEHCIKSVRDAKERFTEDALRILRAIRFSAQLGFQIDPKTIEGIKACKHLLAHISRERIRDEFLKICLSDRPEYIDKLYELGLLEYIVPEFIPAYQTTQHHPHHIYNVAKHSLVAMKEVPKDVVLRLTMLLHDIGKPATKTTDAKGVDHFYNHPKKSVEMAKHILKDLRLDNDTIRKVLLLVGYHDYHFKKPITKVYIKELLGVMGPELFEKLILVQIADAKAQNPEKLAAKMKTVENVKVLFREILENEECYNLKQLAITGSDLMAIGVPKGKIIGEKLGQALAYVLQHPDQNQRETLLDYMQKH